MNPYYPPDCQNPDDAGFGTCALCGWPVALDTCERDAADRPLCRKCAIDGGPEDDMMETE